MLLFSIVKIGTLKGYLRQFRMVLLYYISTFCFLCYIFLHLTWKLWKRKLSFLPAKRNVPWLGSLPFLNTHPHELYKDQLKLSVKHNYLYVVWLGPQPFIIAGKVDYVEPLLRNRDRITRPYKAFHDWLGNGLFTADGEHWKKRRVQLTGAFHFTILNNFMDIYEEHANNLVDHLKIHTGREGKILEVQELMARVMLDVICETSMGVSVKALESANSEYLKAADRLKSLTTQRFFPSIKNIRFIYPFTSEGEEYKKMLNTVNNFTRNVIKQNIALKTAKPVDQILDPTGDEDVRSSYLKKKKRVFIDVLLDLYEERAIDIKGIQDELNTFVFAGHDTMSTAISWTLYEIGRHPDIQLKAQQEIDELASKDLPLVDKIRFMKYTEGVIKESLRIHPPGSSFSRDLDEDMIVPDGNVIPAGTVFVVDILAIHNNPEYWPDPHVFDPQRFLSEDLAKRSPYCFLPFSAGARNCIGQKFAMLDLKVFIFTLLQNFNVVSMQDPKDMEPGIQIVTSSLNGIHIKFSKRQ